MTETELIHSKTEIAFCSSLKGDSWSNLSGVRAFESWHFDAMSDDGSEALIISFHDNYALSPRYYSSSDTSSEVEFPRFPAVSLAYSNGGKVILNCVNEFAVGDFLSTCETPDCSIASSSFRIDEAEYGSGFMVKVDIVTRRGRRIRAEVEWLLIESDLMQITCEPRRATWNVAAPRADVSGRIELIGRRGKVRKHVHFRGTGYHDHISSQNVHYRELISRMWGRAHFVDSTVLFERHGGIQNRNSAGKIFLIRDGEIEEHEAACEVSLHKRDRFGLRVPRSIIYSTGDIRLSVLPRNTVRSGFCEVKMLGDVILERGGQRTRQAAGLMEFIDPRRMQNQLFRWISDLRIGRNGRSPLF